MLTREMENNQIKCGSYWTDEVYGPLRLKLISEDPYLAPTPSVAGGGGGTGGGSSSAYHHQQGFFFPPPPSNLDRTNSSTMFTPGGSAFRDAKQAREDRKRRQERENQIITRRFVLTHTAYPKAEPRHVTQLQFLGWQDMNVPDDARGVLSLVDMAAKAQEEGEAEGKKQRGRLRRRRRMEQEQEKKKAPRSQSRLGGVGVKDDQRMEDDDSGIDESSEHEEDDDEEEEGEEGRQHFDPDTGVVRKRSPILLHCSAGVGRTGGFIVVDAVLDGIRREMLKSHQAQTKIAPPPAQGRNDSESTIGSSDNHRTGSQPQQEEGRMDVDVAPRQAYPEKPPHRRASVSAGRDIVHIPVIATAGAGQSSASLAQDEDDKMDVDVPVKEPAQQQQQATEVPLTPAQKHVVAKQDREEKKRQQDLSTQRWAESVDRATSFVADTVAAAPGNHPQPQQPNNIDPDVKMGSSVPPPAPLQQLPSQLDDPSSTMMRHDSEVTQASKGSGSSGASTVQVDVTGSQVSSGELSSATSSSVTATRLSSPGSGREDSAFSSSDEVGATVDLCLIFISDFFFLSS
jgi:protein tyrosine phosphatase